MDRMKNPFTPGAGALPPELAGRQESIEDGRVLSGRTLNGRYEKSLMLIGLRGVGKTVLLKYLAESARRDGVIPLMIEVREPESAVEELAVRLKEVLSSIDFSCKVKSSVNFAFSALRNFVKSISVNIGEFGVTVETAPGVGDTGNMEFDLSEVLKAAARAAREADTAIGLYIDELQNMDIAAMRGIIVALHHAAQDGLPLYLVGSGLPSIRALVGKSKTYAERMFNYREIGALSEQDVAVAISKPFGDAGVDVTTAAIGKIFTYSGGYPYFLQEYGYQLWLEIEGEKIDEALVDRALPLVHDRLDENFFDVRYERVTNKEREFLRTMADIPSPIAVSEVAERLKRPLNAISAVRATLIRKGMVYSPSHGEIAYTVPLFGDYMRRVLPDGL